MSDARPNDRADGHGQEGAGPVPAARAGAPKGEPLLFDAVLYPHRSLSPAGFWLIMTGIALVSFAAGIAFLIRGAWPIFGFFGLDVLLMYWAFKASYRSGRLHETIRLSREALVIERIQPSGRRQSWRFQPHWLRVELDDPPQHGSQLTLRSHGKALVVGAFLTPQERAEVAVALRRALIELRSPSRG
jgi:uncharacterized membrane protein